MFVPIGTEESRPRRKFPIIAALIVGANTLIFVFEIFLLFIGGERALASFFNSFGVIPAAITNQRNVFAPYFLTPLTAMFIHGSLTHILFNMLYLMVFGDNVEDRLGSFRFLVLYLLSGISAVALQVMLNADTRVPTIGASGAIAGVLSAYLILFPEGKVRLFIFAGPLTRIRRAPALLFLIFWFVIQFFNGVGSLGIATAETAGVAYWAHIGGFLCGLILTGIYRLFNQKSGAAYLEESSGKV
jgi:membrane associated rhomboid family serine protease